MEKPRVLSVPERWTLRWMLMWATQALQHVFSTTKASEKAEMMISVKRHALLGNMCDKVSQDLTLLFPHKNKGSGSTQGKVEASSHIVLEDTRVGYIAHTLKVFSVKQLPRSVALCHKLQLLRTLTNQRLSRNHIRPTVSLASCERLVLCTQTPELNEWLLDLQANTQPAEAVRPKTHHIWCQYWCVALCFIKQVFCVNQNQDSLRRLQAHIDITDRLGKINHKKLLRLHFQC